MSILDDAIREHLDLKRRHGAAESDVQRLEQEAFGPPARPGEPDFPDTQSAGDTNGEHPGEVSPGAPEGPVAPPPAEPAPAPDPSGPEDTAAEHPVLPAEEPPTELVAEEPPLEPLAEEPPPLPDEGAADAPDAAAAAIYDHSADAGDDFDLEDLDLELEDEELSDEQPLRDTLEREAGAPEAPPIESLPTQEHHFADEVIVPEEVGRGAEPEPAREDEIFAEDEEDAAPAAPAKPDTSEDDVLADTPEFLRDAPEDDELWFEQREPKDFDFDE